MTRSFPLGGAVNFGPNGAPVLDALSDLIGVRPHAAQRRLLTADRRLPGGGLRCLAFHPTRGVQCTRQHVHLGGHQRRRKGKAMLTWT